MMAAILVLIVACTIFWLVFFKFKWLRLTPGWGLIFAFFVICHAALLPTFADLLKKGGAKAVVVGADAEHMAIATTSVWGSAADIAKLTGSDDWKAAAGKLKRKSYTTEVFEVAP